MARKVRVAASAPGRFSPPTTSRPSRAGTTSSWWRPWAVRPSGCGMSRSGSASSSSPTTPRPWRQADAASWDRGRVLTMPSPAPPWTPVRTCSARSPSRPAPRCLGPWTGKRRRPPADVRLQLHADGRGCQGLLDEHGVGTIEHLHPHVIDPAGAVRGEDRRDLAETEGNPWARPPQFRSRLETYTTLAGGAGYLQAQLSHALGVALDLAPAARGDGVRLHEQPGQGDRLPRRPGGALPGRGVGSISGAVSPRRERQQEPARGAHLGSEGQLILDLDREFTWLYRDPEHDYRLPMEGWTARVRRSRQHAHRPDAGPRRREPLPGELGARSTEITEAGYRACAAGGPSLCGRRAGSSGSIIKSQRGVRHVLGCSCAQARPGRGAGATGPVPHGVRPVVRAELLHGRRDAGRQGRDHRQLRDARRPHRHQQVLGGVRSATPTASARRSCGPRRSAAQRAWLDRDQARGRRPPSSRR